MSESPSAVELLATSGALIGVEHLGELGYDGRATARILRGLPEIAFPGVNRVYFAVEDVCARLRELSR